MVGQQIHENAVVLIALILQDGDFVHYEGEGWRIEDLSIEINRCAKEVGGVPVVGYHNTTQHHL